MTDTQWPRYVVLHQDRSGNPHRYAGSVHAPDAEMALLNARDVFVRRPECISLWVVRASLIHALTAEEIEENPDACPTPIDGARGASEEAGARQPYYVFQKIGQRGVHQHVGDMEAASPQEAMRKARGSFPMKNVAVWWVFPAGAVRQSTPEDIEQLFQIAETKIFRDQGQYHTVAALRQIKEQKEQEQTPDAG